ncbi:MAG: transposase [Candidatus Riflebacteria bacterium]|nr:transposase [Candidatus Riflebacteria bacterium]
MNHIPIIDNNPRRGEKKEFESYTKERYKERTTVERVFSRLKDEFGGRTVRVRGNAKVFAHLMFGVLALTVDQLMKFIL